MDIKARNQERKSMLPHVCMNAQNRTSGSNCVIIHRCDRTNVGFVNIHRWMLNVERDRLDSPWRRQDASHRKCKTDRQWTYKSRNEVGNVLSLLYLMMLKKEIEWSLISDKSRSRSLGMKVRILLYSSSNTLGRGSSHRPFSNCVWNHNIYGVLSTPNVLQAMKGGDQPSSPRGFLQNYMFEGDNLL